MLERFKQYKGITNGFSLVEMIIYILILVSLLVVIMNITVSIVRSQRAVKASRNVENSAMISLERITREVRQMNDVSSTLSVFDTNPGTLVLNSTDIGGNPRTVEFYVASSTIFMKENGVVSGALSQSDAVITNLIFRHFSNASVDGIRIEMTIESGTSTYYRVGDFYSSAILR